MRLKEKTIPGKYKIKEDRWDKTILKQNPLIYKRNNSSRRYVNHKLMHTVLDNIALKLIKLKVTELSEEWKIQLESWQEIDVMLGKI